VRSLRVKVFGYRNRKDVIGEKVWGEFIDSWKIYLGRSLNNTCQDCWLEPLFRTLRMVNSELSIHVHFSLNNLWNLHPIPQSLESVRDERNVEIQYSLGV